MSIAWDTKIYCLIGHPISKSLSPIIHNNFYKINSKNNIYLTFDIKKEDLGIVINSFKALNIKGFNVTLPHKINIIEYLDDISKEAKLIGAVNTVKNENGRLIGYNTDGIGFLKSLELEGIDIKDKTILILGSGGAANAIATTLAMVGAKTIMISNRTLSKAQNLAIKIKKQFPKIIVQYDDLSLNSFKKNDVDMIINCTSVGMYPNIDETPITFNGFSKKMLVYDIIYKPQKTKFLKLAEEKGFFIIGGLSMLINQALCSQNIWLEDKYENIYDKFDTIKRICQNYVE